LTANALCWTLQTVNLAPPGKQMYKLVFRNTLFLITAEVLNKASSFLVTILLARYLGSADFGRLSFVLSVVGLLYIVADLGISTLAVRELAQRREQTREYVEQLVGLKLILGAVMVIGAWLVVAWLKDDALIQQISLPLAVSMAITSLVQVAYIVFRSHERMKFESIIKIVAAGATLAILVWLILSKASLVNISIGYAAANAIVLAAAVIVTVRNFTAFVPRFNPRLAKNILALSWPFALGTMFASLYRYIDSIMLGYFVGVAEVGWYSAAYRLVDAVGLGAILFGTALYPTLSRLAKDSTTDRLTQLARGALKVISWGIVPIAGLIFVLSRQIMAFFYGIDYLPGAWSLSLLIWTAMIAYFNMVAVKAFQAKGSVMFPVWAAGAGAAINIALNLWLIPRYGISGAAISTAIAYGVVFIILWILSWKTLGLNLLQYMARPAIAIIPALYVSNLPAMRSEGVFPTIFVGLAIYWLGVWLMGGIRMQDITKMRDIVLGRTD
jgi:O-antigen/teichoic acid export membrane protein